MKQFNFESKHMVTVKAEEVFAKLSRVERTAVIKAMGYAPADLLKSFDLTRPEGREGYGSAVAQYSAKLAKADTIDRLVNNGAKFEDLTAEQQAVTVGSLGLTVSVQYEAVFEKLPYKERYELLRSWAEGVNAWLKQQEEQAQQASK